MTTTPGPRTAWLRTVIVEHATSFQGEADAVALVAEFEDRIRAEARADVDGLVARIADLGWTGLPQYAIAYAAAIRDVLALLAGKEDE